MKSKRMNEEVKEKKGIVKKFITLTKLILFITMLGLVYIISPRIAKVIIDLGVENLTRIVNMILVTVVVAIYFFKRK